MKFRTFKSIKEFEERNAVFVRFNKSLTWQSHFKSLEMVTPSNFIVLTIISGGDGNGEGSGILRGLIVKTVDFKGLTQITSISFI